MAEEPKHDLDQKTRSGIAYISIISVWILIGYIIVRFGDKTEILTLIIGFISGSASTILALYFGGVLSTKPKTPLLPGTTTADINITANTNTEDAKNT